MELTYKIIGADGAEYGPVPLDELKNWVLDGRVAGPTHVWRNDLSRWSPASGYTELQPELEKVAEELGQSKPGEARAIGFWPRVGAYLIDLMVLQGIFLAIWGPAPALPSTPSGLPDFEAIYRQLGPLLTYRILIQMGYTVLLVGQFGGTLGKLAIGARIVSVDGTRVGFARAFFRWAATILTQLTVGIGFLLVALRPDKRALHDLLAGTKVVAKEAVES